MMIQSILIGNYELQVMLRAKEQRLLLNINDSADADNNVVSTPIRTSLLEGLTEEEFFIVAPGTRKSIKDKSRFTPDSGLINSSL